MADAVKSMVELKGLSFPLSEEKLAEVLAAVRARTDLPCPSRNEPPRLSLAASPVSRHLAIQAYIEAYEYNFTGENFFNVKGVRQNQSLFRVLDVAKRVIRESLPIKCVEAVYLGIYCTQSMPDIERLPIIFNSEISGHRYGHIVLAVRYSGKLGAIGLSRRSDLMFKAWGFDTLSDLILNYKLSYEKWSHKLNKIKLVGMLIPHEGDSRVNDVVEWASTVISCKGVAWLPPPPLSFPGQLHMCGLALVPALARARLQMLRAGTIRCKSAMIISTPQPADAPSCLWISLLLFPFCAQGRGR